MKLPMFSQKRDKKDKLHIQGNKIQVKIIKLSMVQKKRIKSSQKSQENKMKARKKIKKNEVGREDGRKEGFREG